MWAALWEELDELEWLVHYLKKTTVTAFFSDVGEYFLDILPRNRLMCTNYFAREVIGGSEDVCCPEARNTHQRKVALHFDNVSIRSNGWSRDNWSSHDSR
jgi:hypothetical protein